MNSIMTASLSQDNEALFTAIVESSQDAIISKDLESRITSWNKAAERIFGFTAQEMVGRPMHTLLPTELLHEEAEIIAHLKAGHKIEHFETERLHKNGSRVRVSLMISPIRNVLGIVTGASHIARDITRQRLSEERLQTVLEMGKKLSSRLEVKDILDEVTEITTRLSGAAFGAFFYNTVDSSGEAYMLYSIAGVPRSAFENFPMPRNTEIFSTTFSGAGVIRSSNIQKDPRYGKNAPYNGMPEGHLPVVSYLAVPVISYSGKVIGGLFFGHPEEAKFEQEHESLVSAVATQAAIALDNARLFQEVNSLNKKKDEFISFASHELKTPLTTLKGYLQIANSSSVQLKDIIPKLYSQVIRLQEIINELLDMSKIQAGKLDLEMAPTELGEIIHPFKQDSDAFERNLHWDLPAGEIVVNVDPRKMGYVLSNLLTNAVKYSNPATNVTVKAAILGEEVQISVRDEGIGIEKAHLANIFNPYFRTDGGRNQAKGVGLGLYISKEIVTAHGGRIWAESEIGKGSVFTVALPLGRL